MYMVGPGSTRFSHLFAEQPFEETREEQMPQVRHVQVDIDREGLYRYRREMVEDVETRGKRIQQARCVLKTPPES